MDKPQNKFMSVHYQLYTIDGGERRLEEQTSREHPFEFISGFNIALDGFERRLLGLAKDSAFDFTLTPEEGFGPYYPEGIHQLNREVFMVNGHFDHENIYPGAVIMLLDEEEHRFMARIVEVTEDHVTIDTNHPLAGKTLNFTGLLLENRDATLDEIQAVLNRMGGDECCGCGCGHHHDGDQGDCCHHHDSGEGCGHHHHDGDEGCGCGHCNHNE